MTEQDLLTAEWITPLRHAVTQEFAVAIEALCERRPQLQEERHQLDERRKGWSTSLADPNLNPKLRELIQTEWAHAVERSEEIDAQLAEASAGDRSVDELFDLAAAARRLVRLEKVLASDDATLVNLELSQYLDRIECDRDGCVMVRTCKLGAFPDALNALLAKFESASSPPNCGRAGDADPDQPSVLQSAPRRRAKLRVDPFAADALEQKDAAHFISDPNRFSDLPSIWFWEERASIPEKTCWASENAVEVARMRGRGLTMEALAEHFGKTVPTVRAALRRAVQTEPSVKDLPKKMRRAKWAIDHAGEVARLKRQGMSTIELAEHFGKSDTTIREALTHAERHQQEAGGVS